jgi:hypothetical protein
MNPPDPGLLQGCRAGDAQAWRQLVSKYERLVLSIPLNHDLSREDAAEIARTVFSVFIQCLATLHDDGDLGGWLALVTRMRTWRLLQRRQREYLEELDDASVRWDEAVGPAALPPMVRARLMQRFAEYARVSRRRDHFQRLAAVLVSDSALQAAGAGLRTVEAGPARRLDFTTALADVSLDLLQPPWDRRFDLLGRRLSNQESRVLAEFMVQALREGQVVAIATADELGEFWFEALEPDSYQLLLSTATLELALSPIILMR